MTTTETSNNNNNSDLNSSGGGARQQQQQQQQPARKQRSKSSSMIPRLQRTTSREKKAAAASPKKKEEEAEEAEDELYMNWKKRAIGPDARYGDDFDFARASHAQQEDPSFNRQYGHLLDLKYQEEACQAEPAQAGRTTRSISTPVQTKILRHQQQRERRNTTTVGFGSGVRREQPCYDVEKKSRANSSKKGSQQQVPSRRTLREEGRSVTWHSDRFRDAFEVMSKRQGRDVLLTVEGTKEEENEGMDASTSSLRRRRQPDNKVPWSPVRAFDDIRRQREAPPKNLVQERLRSFEEKEVEPKEEEKSEKTSSGGPFSFDDIENALDDEEAVDHLEEDVFEDGSRESEGKKDARDLIKKQRERREKFFKEERGKKEDVTTTTDDEMMPDNQSDKSDQPRERKRSVKELLSDFERKSKEVHDEERKKASLGGMEEELSGSRRRVFSDTETMMYETTSSDDVDLDGPPRESLAREDSCSTMIVNETDDAGIQRDMVNLVDGTLAAKKEDEEIEKIPELPPRTPKARHEDQYIMMAAVATKRQGGHHHSDGQYLKMTPSKLSRESVASSSTTTGTNSKQGSSSNLTPSEILVQAVVHHQHHSRTPSQNLVLEHLHQEARATESPDAYVVSKEEDLRPMQEPRLASRPSTEDAQPQRQPPTAIARTTGLPAESPRYCEIADKEEGLSHYEYLYKARSATPLHYETVNVYQEIPEEAAVKQSTSASGTTSAANTPTKKQRKERLLLKPIEGLPDIIGNAPTHRGASSSDPDEEVVPSPSPQKVTTTMVTTATTTTDLSQLSAASSFIPASFFLNQQPRRSSSSQEIGTITGTPLHAKADEGGSGSSRRGSQSSVSNRELPMTPVEMLRSAEDVSRMHHQQQSDGSIRGSISSIDSTGKRGKGVHLPNIQEASNTIERRESRKHLLPDISSRFAASLDEEGDQLEQVSLHHHHDPSSKSNRVPYYVSDIVGGGGTAAAGDTLIEFEGGEVADTLERARAIERLHSNMEYLDAETEQLLRGGGAGTAAGAAEEAMLDMIRSAQQTPVAFPAPVHESTAATPAVPRANSLDGLLGDSPGAPRDNVQVHLLPSGGLVTPTLPARGREPPPPPADVPPLNLSDVAAATAAAEATARVAMLYDEDDEQWRQSLRRASARHQRARSVDPTEEHRYSRSQLQGHQQLQVDLTQQPVSRSLAPSRNAMASSDPATQQQQQQQHESHLSGYVWDESDQRFYKLNDPGSPPDRRVMDPTFLGAGLPIPGDCDDISSSGARVGRPDVAQIAREDEHHQNQIIKGRHEDFTSDDEHNQEAVFDHEDFVITFPPDLDQQQPQSLPVQVNATTGEKHLVAVQVYCDQVYTRILQTTTLKIAY